MAFPTTGLVSYWKLDEASGTRVDSHGTNHLTPTNAPVGAAGKLGNGCDFESSSSQYLSHADPTPLGDESWTYTLWFKHEAVPSGSVDVIGKSSPTYYIRAFGWGVGLWIANDTKAITVTATADTNWHFLIAWHDATANTLNMQYDNGTVQTGPTDGVFPAPNVLPDVTFGQFNSLGYFDGLIDEVGLWRRVLTAQERSDLYNGGAGLAYAPPAPPVFPTANLVSYWRLDEASGTRVDSHGTNHLTPTNAPVGAAGKIGNGCDFESSSSQYLSHADADPLGDEDWTYTLWFKKESLGAIAFLFAKDDATLARCYFLVVNTENTLTFEVVGATNVGSVIAFADTDWHFVVAWLDAAGNTLNLQIDNGVVRSSATSGGPAMLTVPVMFGARLNNGAPLQYFDGLIDEVGLWRRVLTAQERTDLYNGGAGLAYATGSGGAGIRTLSLGYWKQAWHAA